VVNQSLKIRLTRQMRQRILQTLIEATDVVSGQTLSRQLGISRVAVWKHIKKLQAQGVGVVSTPAGYRLDTNSDDLQPWAFPGREGLIHYFDRLTSTMDKARELARAGAAHMSVVIAGTQDKGRGRLDRSWHSDGGGLYFTLVLRPEIPAVHSPRLMFAASLELALVLNAHYGLQARLKWPNDVQVDGRKICGMLSEMEAEGEWVRFVNLGIGINVNNDPAALVPQAVSLQALLGKKIARGELLRRFLERLERRIDRILDADPIENWKALCATLGKQVRIVTPRQVFAGKALDLDPHGALIVEQPDGNTIAVAHGDCFHADAC